MSHSLRRRVAALEARRPFSLAMIREAAAHLAKTGEMPEGTDPLMAERVLQLEAASARMSASVPSDPDDGLLVCAERDRLWRERARVQAIARRNPYARELVDDHWPPANFPPHLDSLPTDTTPEPEP